MSKPNRTRRQFSDDFKRRVVAEAGETRSSWSQVARKYDLNTNLLHRWRRQFEAETVFLPVELEVNGSPPPNLTVPAEEDQDLPDIEGAAPVLEVFLPDGTQLCCDQGMEPALLSAALEALRKFG